MPFAAPWAGALSGTLAAALPAGGALELLVDPMGSCACGTHAFQSLTVTEFTDETL
jgi:hypothetical protein